MPPDAITGTAMAHVFRSAPEVVKPPAHTPIDQCDAARWVGKFPEPLVHTVDDLLIEGTAALLVAPGGAGKSLLQQLLLTVIPTGLPFLGRSTAGGAAAGIFCEDFEPVLHARQQRINAVLGIDEETLVGRLYIGSYAGLDCCLWRDGGPTQWAMELEQQLARIPELRCVTIDNAALVYGDEWNDPQAVTRFMAWLNGLAHRLKVAILLSTHVSKSYDKTGSKLPSGTTAWVNAARACFDLTPETAETPPSITLIKSNYTKANQKFDLVWREAVLLPAAAPDEFALRFRRQAIERLILDRVAKAWAADYPLSSSPQTADRYLPRALAASSEYPADELKNAMMSLLTAGRLRREQRNTRTPMGLNVVKENYHENPSE